MKIDKFIRQSTMLLFVAVSLFSIQVLAQEKPKPWNVPESAKKVKNPVKNNAENLNIGKGVYAKHCKSCHGKSGEGDGTKAAELKTFSGDFTAEAFRAQSESEIFYKTSEGRDDMPSFRKKIDNEEDIWAVVLYINTLKK